MNFLNAKKIFAEYLRRYNTSDDKIRLKIVHTYGVVNAAEAIAKGLHLSQEDTDLARHIALLHDIGRFEQLRRYNSFDDSIIPHAELSLTILFDEGMISDFIQERCYDSLIYTAIKYHGVYSLPPSLTGSELLHSQIIRDADKLDNFRVKETDSILTMLDVTEEDLADERISDHMYESFLNHKPILNSERETHMDMWISYLAYIFDLNFDVSLAYVEEHDIVNKLLNRVSSNVPETRERIEAIKAAAYQYLNARTRFIG